MEATYGELWEFNEHVAHWSFDANRFKNYVYLCCRVTGQTPFHPWNYNEKVVLIEEHVDEYVIMSLREVDDNGTEKDHVHSIVMNVNDRHGRFDLDNLITFLQGSQMEPLVEEFERIGYLPWVDGTAKSNARKLRAILLTMDRCTSANVEIPTNLRHNTTATRRRNEELLSAHVLLVVVREEEHCYLGA